MSVHPSPVAACACLVAVALGCGGNVVVDGETSRGTTGSASTASHGTSSMGNGPGGAGAGGASTASLGTSGTGGAMSGVSAGGNAGVGGNTGVSVTSSSASGSSASSSSSSSSSGAGGGTTNALWDILGLYPTPPAGAFVQPPYIAVDASGDTYLATSYIGGPLNFAGALPCANKLNVMVAKVSSAGQLIWSRCVPLTSIGDSLSNSSFSLSGITITPAGIVALLGRFSGTIDFGSGSLTTGSDLHVDAFVVALDASAGAGVWGKQFVYATDQAPSPLEWGLASDAAGDLYVGGALYGPIDLGGGAVLSPSATESAFVAKLDASGVGLWATEIAYVPVDGEPLTSTIAVSADSAHCVLATSFSGTALFGDGEPTGSPNPLIVELDAAAGSIEWGILPAGIANIGNVSSAVFDADGSLVLAGGFGNSLDLGGGPMGAHGGVFVAKLDPGGTLRWQLVAERTWMGDFSVDSVAIDATGEILYAATSLDVAQAALGAQTLSCPVSGAGFSCFFVGTIDAAGHPGAYEVVRSRSLSASDEHYRGASVAFGSGEKLLAGVFPRWIDFGGGHVPNPVTSPSVFLAALP